MSIRVSIVSVAVVCALFSGSGCNIETCEEGAICNEEGSKHAGDDKQCKVYCARVTICDPHGIEFDDCVDTCESGFESDPEITAQLCACAEWSTCEDITSGHCSEKPNGSGGNGSGGNETGGTGAGGSGAGGTSAGGTGSGGTSAGGTSSGGTSSGGTSSGGTSAGGTSAGGTSAGGTSAGGTNGGGTSAGGTSAGGTSAGGAGATDAGGIACAHDCDCPAGENCVSGYCAPTSS